MDKFDRERQNHILKVLYDCYPNSAGMVHGSGFNFGITDDNDLVANLFYLEGHGLIVSGVFASSDGFAWDNYQTRIKPKGIDFIRDDGGIGAVLNVQTIRLHSDTLVTIESIISAANLPESERKGLISKLRELPVSAITHLTNELTLKAVLAAPAALPIIQKFLHTG